jgi:ribosomal protein S18 acetylase RimI-like enzyme
MFTFSNATPTEAEVNQIIKLHAKAMPLTRFSVLPPKVQTKLYMSMIRNTKSFHFMICRSEETIVGVAVVRVPHEDSSGFLGLLLKNLYVCIIPIIKHVRLFVCDTYESIRSESVYPDHASLILIFTDSMYQRQGIARELINMAPSRLKALTRIDNGLSQKMYLRNSFVKKRRIGNSILFVRDVIF